MTPSRNRLLSEAPAMQVKDYKYFASLFGSSNAQNLLDDLEEDIKEVKKSVKYNFKLRDDPVDMTGTLERKEEFK